MCRRPPVSTLPDPPFPYTPLFRSESPVVLRQAGQAIAKRNADEEGEGAVAAMIGDDLVKFAGGGKIMARRRSIEAVERLLQRGQRCRVGAAGEVLEIGRAHG